MTKKTSEFGIHSIRDIDDTTYEGKLLLMTLTRLSTEPGYDMMEPDEILGEMVDLVFDVYYTECGS